MWYKELGYDHPEDYFMDSVRFPYVGQLKNGPLVRVALSVMCDEEGIPRTEGLRCCRSCGRMTPKEDTCDQCGSPV